MSGCWSVFCWAAGESFLEALRIAVNDELGSLQSTLPVLFSSLRENGRLCVISFHSLEDRIVKRAFLRAAGRIGNDSMEMSLVNSNLWNKTDHHHHGLPELSTLGQILTKKPIVPKKKETEDNARSRSAKLRVFQKTSK